MEGQSIVSDKLKFHEIRTKFKASRDHVNWPGLKLVTSANDHNLIFVGFEDKTIKAVPTDQILISRKAVCTDQFIHTIQLTFTPTILSVARNGFSSILLASGYNDKSDCPNLELFNIDDRSSIGRVELNDLRGARIVDYAWHPTYYESILTLCTDRGNLLVVGFSRKDKRASVVYKDQQYGALTCCWSPKGKNLAIGTSSGKILRLEHVITANSFTFKEVKNGTLTFEHPNVTPQHQVIKIRWIIKTSLICAHARPGDTNTIYSITTVKPGKPYKYWTNLCYEKDESQRNVQLMNLTSSLICSSNSSSEAAVLGVDSCEEATLNEPTNWNSIVIDEEGGRIELPLDDDNRETYSRGVTVTIGKPNSEFANRPILVFFTSDGFLCPFVAVHSNNILKLPELQQLEVCPLNIPKPIVFEQATKLPEMRPLDMRLPDMGLPDIRPPPPIDLRPNTTVVVEEQRDSFNISVAPAMEQIQEGIAAIKRGIEQNAQFLSRLNEINQLRAQFDEIQGIHKAARDVLDNIKSDIDSLDLGILEDRYLISICNKGATKRRSPSPRTLEKIEAIKQKSKLISGKLRDLNAHVDMSWEDYVRRRNALENKERRLNSLDMIYKTLANNQKIINFLKKKSTHLASLPPAPKPAQVDCDSARFELDPARMRALREFLASRSTVPVRRPESVRSVSRRSKLY